MDHPLARARLHTNRQANTLFSNSQAQGLHDFQIRRGAPILLVDDSKAAGVVPHGPTDAVLFQGGANVPNPDGTISRRREVTKGPKLVTGKRHLIFCSPGGSDSNLTFNSGGVPTVLAIAKQIETSRFILNRIENFADAFHSRWVGDVRVEKHVGPRPRRTLMRERKGLIKVEVVNNIPIRIRHQKQQLRET